MLLAAPLIAASVILAAQVPAFDDPQSLPFAARKGDAAQVRALLDANPELIDVVDSHGRAPVLYASKAGHVEALKIILDHKPATIDNLDGYQFAALHWAAMYAKLDAIRLLAKYKADLNVPGMSKMTPLHMAMGNPFSNVHGKHAQVVKLLVELGADPNRPDGTGMTPLHAAAGLVGRADAAQAMVEAAKKSKREVDLNARDDRGGTPLHKAAAFANVEMVKFLLAAGADRALKNADGKTPLDLAKQAELKNSPETIKLLSE